MWTKGEANVQTSAEDAGRVEERERERDVAKANQREMRTDHERQSEEGKQTTPIRPRHEEAAITSALVIERKWLKVLLGSRKRLLPSLPCLPLPSAIVSSFSFRIFFSFFFFDFLFGFFL
ncbi:hypothetical protein ALC60_01961 [Trachymyrmex zeteki]|uniref:Uncharacterized protein n=1 Tax=Mycetomoellerius zeteki TaxID=64791 RepID=A0A151XFB1_9HYME|nr:hypothetical protein ALC60_01961 [Trachymyrmex zeteki]